MQLPIQLQFSSVSSLRYTLQVGVSVIAITDTQLYRLEIFSKTGTELFGGANSRSFDCFPRQTASGSSSGVFEYLRLSGPKDWYSRLLLFIYLFYIYSVSHWHCFSHRFFDGVFEKHVRVAPLCSSPTVHYLLICGRREYMHYASFCKL